MSSALDLLGPTIARLSAREQVELCGRLLLGMSPPDPYMSAGRQPLPMKQADLDNLRRIIEVISVQMMAPPDPHAGGSTDEESSKTISALICPCCQAAIRITLSCA
jgi:hypothetical protein